MQFRAVKCAQKEYTCEGRGRINICSNSFGHHMKAYFIKFDFFLIVTLRYLVHHQQ